MELRIQLRFFGYTSSLNFGYILKTVSICICLFLGKSLAVSLELPAEIWKRSFADDVDCRRLRVVGRIFNMESDLEIC